MNTTPKLIAFHGDPKLKEAIVSESRRHREQDMLIHGNYGVGLGDDFRGCAVGCAIHSLNALCGTKYRVSDHSCYEPGFGVPTVLAKLQDGIFEGLPADESLGWPNKFWESIPCGADLSMVWPQFALWLLVDPEHGMVRNARSARSKADIEAVAALYRRWCSGDKPRANEWQAADASAYAYAHATAAAEAADAAAAYARRQARRRQAAQLLSLMASAPVI